MQGSLAERLRVLRAQRGLTLVEAAEKTGIGRDTLSDLERGRRHPVLPTVAKIARGYDVSVEELLEDSPKAEAPTSATSREDEDRRPRPFEMVRELVIRQSEEDSQAFARAKESGLPQASFVRHENEARDRLVEQYHPVDVAEAYVDLAKEHLTYPYPWMGDTLADTVARWNEYSAAPTDSRYSHTVALACLDVLQSVLKYDAPGKTLRDRVPEHEVEQRITLADWLGEIAQRAQDHYVDSIEAQAAEVENLEKRRNEVMRLAKDTA